MWAQKIRMFMRKALQGETKTDKQKRLGTAAPPIPRQSTFNWLRDMSNSMACVAGIRWGDFLGQQDLLLDDSPLEPPAFLVICTDEEAKQLSGTNFLKWQKALRSQGVSWRGRRRLRLKCDKLANSSRFSKTERCTSGSAPPSVRRPLGLCACVLMLRRESGRSDHLPRQTVASSWFNVCV